jgi:hypothetical protein
MREATTRPAILAGRGHRLLKALEEVDVFIEPHKSLQRGLSAVPPSSGAFQYVAL